MKGVIELSELGLEKGAKFGASVAVELDGKVYQELAGTTYIPIQDRQGNITLLLDLQGNPQETYHYDAFGNETIYSSGAFPILNELFLGADLPIRHEQRSGCAGNKWVWVVLKNLRQAKAVFFFARHKKGFCEVKQGGGVVGLKL